MMLNTKSRFSNDENQIPTKNVESKRSKVKYRSQAPEQQFNKSQGFTSLTENIKQILNITKVQQLFCQKIAKNSSTDSLEPRDRIIDIPLPHQNGNIKKEVLISHITDLCKTVWSRAYHYFSTNQMDFEHVKTFSSQSILRNIIKLAKKFQLKSEQFEIINSHIQKNILDYMLYKYPITLSQVINKNVNNVIKQVDFFDKLENDYLYKSTVKFKYRQNGEYNDFIMLSLNEVFRKIASSVTNKTLYEKFQQKMERLFGSVLDEDWMRDKEIMKYNQDSECDQKLVSLYSLTMEKQNLLEESMIKRRILKQKQKEQQKYRSKVQQYTSFKISKKLSQSTHLFTDNQIFSHNIKIDSPQILRILTKWCQELQRKFLSPRYISQCIDIIKLENGQTFSLDLDEMKQNLQNLLRLQSQLIKNQIQSLKKNNYSMQSQLLMRQLINMQCFELQKYERISSHFSIDIVNNLHFYTITYLNRLIHGLLNVSNKFGKLSVFGPNCRNSNIDLISFQIQDLFRCRCTSGQKQIIRIYSQIIKMCQYSNMKLVKVLNRLKNGTHDILIIVNYHQVLCQIQLIVTNDTQRLIEHSNMFNHYFQELKRSIFGPLTELCNIWKNIDQRFNFYKKIHIQNKRNLSQNKVNVSHLCNTKNTMISFSKPFICSCCNQNYYHNQFIKQHIKCIECSFWICGRCRLKQSDCKKLLNIAYHSSQIIKHCKVINEREENIPNYGICILIESQQIKIEPFHRIVAQNKIKIIGIQNKRLYEIFEISSLDEEQKFREKYLIFEINEEYGRQHIKTEEKILKFLIQQNIKYTLGKGKSKIRVNNSSLTDYQLEQFQNAGNVGEKQNIKCIEMIFNQIQKITSLITTFPKIKNLQLAHNLIQNIDGISHLKHLQKLNLNNNKIKDVPQECFSMITLQQLSLCDNQIKSLPFQLASFCNLKTLRLSNNKIKQFPVFSQKTQEYYISINSGVKLQQPAVLFTNLQVLQIQNNYLTSIHQSIEVLVHLKVLNLSHNQISILPPNFYKVQSLSVCSLRNNKLTNISQAINQMHNLVFFDISNNSITEIPSISLPLLVELNSNNNKLTILHQFHQKCISLKYLSVSHNKLSKIESLFYLTNLQVLHLNNNKLESFPKSIEFLHQLQQLNLQQNQINNIPELNLGSLKKLNLSSNRIKMLDSINMHNLQQLSISNNQLTALPTCQLPALKIININYNKLNKMQLMKCPKLKQIYANNNNLQELPTIITKRINKMDLSNNNIANFNYHLKSYSSLVQLNLANNKIKTISKQVQHLTNLKNRQLQLTSNPIQNIECWQFLLQKATRSTLDYLSTIKLLHMCKPPQIQISICIDTQSRTYCQEN